MHSIPIHWRSYHKTFVAIIFSGFVTMAGLAQSADRAASPPRASESKILYGMKAASVEGHAKRQPHGDYIESTGDFRLNWQVEALAPGDYLLRMDYAAPSTPGGRTLALTIGENRLVMPLAPTRGYFADPAMNYERVEFPQRLHLTEKTSSLVLEIKSRDGNDKLNLRSLELRPVSTQAAQAKEEARAVAGRAQPAWLASAAYGVMFHWTSQSVAPDGTHKSYAQAVRDFDVQAFAAMVESMGAAHVIFTIGHAEPFCPAPIKAWEKYHPDRTTSRDLIMEIADQLAARDIKLLCYFPTHVVAKIGRVSESEFSQINREIMQEFGERYGPKVAGYWFDGWYQSLEKYPNVSLEEFYRVCKTGNADRLVTVNSWIFPSLTPWQDYWAGEVADLVALPPGRIPGYGPAKGLPWHTLLIMEPYWVQETAAIPSPNFTAATLGEYIKASHAIGGVVTINLGIYQNGTVGAEALEVMRQIRRNIRH